MAVPGTPLVGGSTLATNAVVTHISARRPGRAVRAVMVLAALAMSSVVRAGPAPRPVGGEDPFDVMRAAPKDSAGIRLRGLAPNATRHWGEALPRYRGRFRTRLPKIDRRLDATIRGDAAATVRVVVTFRDTVAIPRFPAASRRLRFGTPSDSAAIDSLRRGARRVVESIITRRSRDYDSRTKTLMNDYRAREVRRYWLVNAVLLDMPANRVDALALRGDVISIRSNTGGPPPSMLAEGVSIDTLRSMMGIQPYLDAGAGAGWIAILDTGVRTSHELLREADLCMVVNCLDDSACFEADSSANQMCPPHSAWSPGDQSRLGGHGTSTAAILVGRDRAYRGMTRASIDCFNVYNAHDSLDVDAAIRGMQKAIARGNSVIVAEMDEPSIGDIAAAADKAYLAGSVVIAANGNADSIGQPARQRRVIGVGDAYYLPMPGRLLPQSGRPHGLTVEGGLKPDLIAPSRSNAAGSGSDDARHPYGGTSGATPFAAGAALVLRDAMTWGTMGNDVGNVAALLVLSGDRDGPYAAGDSAGAGLIRLPPLDQCQWGKSWVTPEDPNIDVAIEIPDGTTRLTAAIWWPEETEHMDAGLAVVGLLDTHCDLDLEILGEGREVPVATSASTVGVFERTSCKVPPATGSWALRIRSKEVVVDMQRVYWAVWTH